METHARVIVVGGASGGIGRCTALLLAERGDHLILTARGAERLEEVATECTAAGAASVWVHPADVTDRYAVDAMLTAVAARFGRIDGVVHTAGVAAYGQFVDVPPEIFERVIAVNLLGTANVGRSSLRQLAAQDDGGTIVFVGSLLGKIATPFMSSYVTSKWAVHGLVRVLQIEARTMPGVDISLVSPGGVDTPIYRWSATVLGRGGQPPPPVDPPDKVARAIVACLDKPRRERSVGVANPTAVFGFRAFPGLFDVLVTPLMKTFGLEPDQAPETRGNLFEPQPEPETSYGDRNAAPIRLTRALVNKGAALVSRSGPLPTRPERPKTQPPAPSDTFAPDQLAGTTPVTRRMAVPPAEVWAILRDGWLYANWVVGASRTRDVDAAWPEPGSRIHHSFGLWPAVLNDTTEVLASEAPSLLHLKARGRPLGAAQVLITLTETESGTTEVTVREDVTAGPGLVAPQTIRQALVAPRNTEALRRLAYLAEGRATTP